MAVKFTNNARTTLAADISNSATTATVTSGSVFPVLNAGEYFYCTFDNGTNNEIVKVTARSGNTLTIVRGVDNTTARAFSTDDAAELRATAGLLTDIQENIAAKSANQTVYNATTASSATDYDIGIDPGLESNAMVFLNGVMQHHDTFSFSGSTLTFDTAPSNGLALEVIVDNLINLQSSNLTVDTFTAADVGGNPQVDFVLSDAPAGETNLIVFVDGVFQANDTYTISSTTLSMTDGVTADMVVTVYVMNPVNIGAPSDNTVTSSKLSGNITMPADLTVTGDVAFDSPTFVVDNANSRVGIGTASPSTLLDIVGDVKMSANLTVDTSTLVVDSTNNRVGIGQTSPKTTLNVAANNSGQGAILTLENSDTSITTNDVIGQIDFYANDGSTNGTGAKVNIKGIAVSGAGTNTALTFGTSDSTSATAIERMRINSSGNVSIGTTTSTAKVNIAANSADGSQVRVYGATNENYQLRLGFDTTNLVGKIQAVHVGTAYKDLILQPEGANVGIGTASPEGITSGVTSLSISDAGAKGSGDKNGVLAFKTDDASYTNTYSDGVTAEINSISESGTGAAYGLGFVTGTITSSNRAERVRISATGSVGIGNTSPSSQDASANNLVISDTAGNGGLTINTPTNAIGAIHFSDGTSGADRYRGIMSYGHSDNSMRFHTDTTRRMTIDSSGNLLLGKTSANNTTAGTTIYGSAPGNMSLVRDGGSSLVMNRLSNDGDIAVFRKDGTTVGSIGTEGSRPYFIKAGAGGFSISSAGHIIPATSTGAVSDNTKDLGISTVRFKDLYLSGQVFFGSNNVPFESGDTLSSSTNYDSLFTNGHYRIDNNATNAPSTTFHAVIVFGNGSNVTTQLAVSLASTTTYIRSYNNAWTSWARLDT